MKNIILLLLTAALVNTVYSQTFYPKVKLETSAGDITIELYDNTPMHGDNFTKLINEGYYNNQLFHRVIKDFMIQAGDPDSKHAQAGEMLGRGGPDYTIPAEFVKEYYHKRGALAAARQPDHTNPAKESSGSQFYIVHGRTFNETELKAFVQRGMHMPFTDEQIEVYSTQGGSPHLDYEYTVFAEVIEGMEVIDKIANKPVDKNNRPLDDVRIIKAYTIK